MQEVVSHCCPLFCPEHQGDCIALEGHTPSIVERLDYCLTPRHRACPLHNVKTAQRIRVVYDDNTTDLVDKKRLDDLIWSSRIRMFYRTDGWAVVGCSPLRIKRRSHGGAERRSI